MWICGTAGVGVLSQLCQLLQPACQRHPIMPCSQQLLMLGEWFLEDPLKTSGADWPLELGPAGDA